MDFLRDVFGLLKLYVAGPAWCWRRLQRSARVAWFREVLANRRRERRLPGRCRSGRFFKAAIATAQTRQEMEFNRICLRALKESLGEVRRR